MFSKRRAGIFKKANELSTLCCVKSTIVLSSLGDRAYSFGNLNVETTTDRFPNNNINNNNNNNYYNLPKNVTHELHKANGNAKLHQQNQELGWVKTLVKQENDRRKSNEKLRKALKSQRWCAPNIDDLNFLQLDDLKSSIMSFKQKFEMTMQDDTSLVNSYA